jgi:transposase InsO family protein
MPWKEPMDERIRFIAELKNAGSSMADVCRRYGISRKTGYKWLDRYRDGGPTGLSDRAPVALSRPHAISAAVEELLVATRRRFPTWGPRKLLAYLADRTRGQLPAASTVGDLLKRRGLVDRSRRRRRVAPYSRPFAEIDQPNAGWSADFKGQFQMGNGQTCYPLTVTDSFSRYLLCCEAMVQPNLANVRSAFERVFERHGLPDVIRTDNGVPFASRAVQGLSSLAVWWIRLGIRHERIAPGRPDQNGRHERMHRTLKQQTALPPKRDIPAQQRAFDDFQREYNLVRPHEALAQKPPATAYSLSARSYTATPPELEYPAHFRLRRVRCHGAFKWRDRDVFISMALSDQHVALEEIDDGMWVIHFGPLRLGLIDEKNRPHKVSPMLPV